MGKIKICYIGPKVQSVDDLVSIMRIKGLPFTEDFVLDEDTPDYLVVSPFIYRDIKYFLKFKRFAYREDIIRIFLTLECISPDMNIFDYAIVFDRKLSNMDRIISWPKGAQINQLTQAEAMSLIASRRRFCNFIYSNAQAHPNRDKLFHALSGYKRVDSLGTHMNNVNTLITVRGGGSRYSDGWGTVSIMMKSKYKFSIAAENASHEGYTTEKLTTSFGAHTVPIYWGNPCVTEEYNSEAFINCNDYASFDDVVRRVREIDEDDELWAYIVSRPFQTEAQVKAFMEHRQHYMEFMTHLFLQPLGEARRRPFGTWPLVYEHNFFEHVTSMRNMFRKFCRDAGIAARYLMIKRTDINDFFTD